LPHHLKYVVLSEQLAICRFAPDTSIPAWATNGDGGFSSIVRTADELSIVCAEARVPGGVQVESGWVALKLQGPFPFSLTGVLSSFLQPLADAQISIFAISTFDTDYVLVKCEQLDAAIAALHAVGHERMI
jgi:hypothetical protein